MPRLVRLALAVITLLALGSSAAAGPRDPRERHTAAGQAVARSAVLRQSDFPRGWKPDRRPGHVARCRYFNPDLSRLTRMGKARSAFIFSHRGEVGSNVSVFLDATQGAAAFHATTTRAFLTCATARLAKGLARSGPVRVTFMHITAGPPLGLPSRTFRVGLRLKFRGHSLAYRYDLSAFQADNALASVWFWCLGGPCRHETDYVRRVASRL
jgi:hypothetical protein